jgi:2-dehydropantoate 2-reductase
MAFVRWIVVGAGAVGGVVGGLLADAGEEVVLVARGPHLDALREHGLRVRTPNRDVTVTCEAVGAVADTEIGAGDIVLLAVKSQDSETALRSLSAIADRRAVIVCLQNGLENERMAARRFAQVLSVPVLLPAAIVEPGVVAGWGRPHPGVLDIGRFPDAPVDELVAQVSDRFVRAGFLSTARADISRWKRRKLLMNVGNAVQALVGTEGSRRLYQLATAEAEACFAAAGWDVATLEEDRANRKGRMEIGEIPGLTWGGGSSWQSLVRSTGSIEADYLNGEVALLGRLHGLPTPVNDLLRRRANAASAAGLAPASTTEQQLLAELENDNGRA